MSPQMRQIPIVRSASSTVTSAPSSSAGIRRAMKFGSNGNSILGEVVEALGWRVPLQPFAIPFDIFLVARPAAEFAHPRVEEQPPFKIARLQEDPVLKAQL